jgi:hypothetical protein
VNSLRGWRSATARDRRTDCLNRRHHKTMPTLPAVIVILSVAKNLKFSLTPSNCRPFVRRPTDPG